MVYEFDPQADAKFLLLPGLKTDQEFNVVCRDGKGRWRPARYFRCFPAPRSDKDAVIDLSAMIHLWGEPITQITVEFSKPGEICLEGPPRLLR